MICGPASQCVGRALLRRNRECFNCDMDRCPTRPGPARAASCGCALLLLVFVGCGRIGYDLLPASLENQGPYEPEDDELDAGETAEDAEPGAAIDAASDAEVVLADADVISDASSPAVMDAAATPQDAAPGIDAADTSVGAADTSVGAADTSIGAADTSVSAADTSVSPIDAAADASDAAQSTPGLRIVVDHAAGAATLRDFPVRVLLDTRTPIQQGQLATDCSNLRIFGSTGCATARSFFLPAHACNSAASEVWVRIPQLAGGAREVLLVTFDATRGEASNGGRVFSFFDNFDGSSLDRARWIARGQGSVSVSGGVLQSQGIMQLESIASAVSAGQSIVGARLALLGEYDTDVELGVGKVSADDPIWAPGRSWDGVTFVSHDFTTYGFDGPAGTPCDDLANSQLTPQIGASWADRPPATAAFQSAEFGYANRSGTAEAWLRSSRSASLSYTAPSGCALPAALPVLITLDHITPSAPIQRVDYVYVRPLAAREPSASVLSASTLACGP
jgi:hypothetical protein